MLQNKLFGEKARIILLLIGLSLILPSGSSVYAQGVGPPKDFGPPSTDSREVESILNILIKQEHAYRLASPDLTDEKSELEEELRKANPEFHVVTIIPEKDKVRIEFQRTTPRGRETLFLNTNPKALSQLNKEKPISVPEAASWLLHQEQPFIQKVTPIQQGNENFIQITCNASVLFFTPAAAPETPPSEFDQEEGAKPVEESEPGFMERLKSRTLVGYYFKGGILMHVILLTSIIGFAIFLERFFVLKRKKIIPPAFIEKIMEVASRADANSTSHFVGIINICKTSKHKDSPIARVLLAGMKRHHEGFREMKLAIEDANVIEGIYMEKNMNFLGLLSNLAPLLGFLGTVTGMIGAFEAIARLASTRPEVVGGGISEALTTTAFGLFIGIPLLVCYHTLQAKVETLRTEIEELAVEVVELSAFGGEE